MNLFSLEGKNAVILGGAGILGASITSGLKEYGAKIAIADARPPKNQLEGSKSYIVDAMSKDSLVQVCESIMQDFGKIDILVNAVGGNKPDATCSDEISFFDLSEKSLQDVVNLNLFGGAILPAQVFGRYMMNNPGGGSIINVSSMCAFRPLTRVVGYSAAKAAVSNFTQWLAVHVAQAGHTDLRVNAIAPGFFLTDQNRFLLTEKDTGELTKRGTAIIDHTPMGRFGDPDDLIGTVVWLASDASRFVTGLVVPIDGGFSAFSGV
ncbi:MAG TPA: SDR family oxidoreductase [Armatimonadota bacterium]|nr:SDR family oxidoreductase [Armatimonadota bacterium]HOM71370.1 SDR family oxidoreductase [Armatimonadota bacterium]HPP73566.1 SDR family oxidoreductase [Armatimonadota bacterium]